MDIGVLWDRLAGGIQEYVENYCLYKSESKIKPSYEVDYQIDCLDELQKHTTVNDYWVHQISGCKHINDLPTYLQELVLQYLPRFFIRSTMMLLHMKKFLICLASANNRLYYFVLQSSLFLDRCAMVKFVEKSHFR